MFYSNPVARQNEVCHQAVDKFISTNAHDSMYVHVCKLHKNPVF